MNEENTGNPKDLLGAKKLPLRLVPKIAMAECALAMGDGAFKYEPYNWRDNAVKLSVYIEAARRHLDLLEFGEDFADDSGCLHAAHVMAGMAIIIDALHTGCLKDDRDHRPELVAIYKQLSEKFKEKSEKVKNQE